ncbi:oligosaccharide flippase family protein [Candidatus Woesearchaeota archaeon]|nr:oligosaccharide flippase family protein [Candidatus Woesearchaeota archaeon]
MDSKLVKENLYMFIGNFILYFLSYIFQFYLGHTFNPEEFGIIGTLFSILTIISLLFYSVQISITQIISKTKPQKTKNLFNQITKHSLILGSFIGIIILAISPILSSFLKINIYFFVIIAIATLLLMLQMSSRGILQGLEKFKLLSINYSYEGLFRLIFGVFFVVLGFEINGVLGALLASYFLSFIMVYFTFKKKDENKNPIPAKEIYSVLPYNLTALLFLNLLGTIDLILARHYLSPLDTGYYAAISTLGKIIPSLSITIGLVLISKSIKKKDNLKLLTKSLLLSILVSIPFILVFFFFPKLIINLSLGPNYLEAGKYLGIFSINATIYSLLIIITYFLINQKRKYLIYITILALFIEVFFISIFHSNILQIIISMLFTILALFVTFLSLIFFSKTPTKQNL